MLLEEMCQVQKLETDSKLFEEICKMSPPREFERKFTVIYKGQVPNVSLLLVSGTVDIEDEKGQREIGTECLIAVRELVLRVPSRASVRIREGAIVSLLDRQVFIEQFQSGTDFLRLGRNSKDFDT